MMMTDQKGMALRTNSASCKEHHVTAIFTRSLVLLIALSATVLSIPSNANAEAGYNTWKSLIWPNWQDWAYNKGPFLTFDALKQAAIAQCKLSADYVNPAVDCKQHAGFASDVTGPNEDEWGTYYLGKIALYRNNGFHGNYYAHWYTHAISDSDCPPGLVVDRADGFNCVDPSTLYELEPSDQPSDCPVSNKTNPCNPSDGNKYQREVDIQSPATGAPAFARYFNSKGVYKTGLGMPAGWRHTYSRSVDENRDRKSSVLAVTQTVQSSFYHSATEACDDGWADVKATVWSGELANATSALVGGTSCKISLGGTTAAYFTVRSGGPVIALPSASIKTVTRANGRSIRFEYDGTNWINELNPALRFEASGSNWIFIDTNDTRETFNAAGQLITITQRNGQSTVLDYDLAVGVGGDGDTNTLDKVTGQFGHEISFAYDANGYLSTVTSSDGIIQYGTDVVDNLVSVSYPDATTRQYVYEDSSLPHHLTGIIDENSDRFATWAYDSGGRAVLSEHAGGTEQVVLAYNANGTTTLTMANGATQTYAFETAQGERRLSSISGNLCSTCPGGNVKSKTYDANGYVSELTDWNGNITRTGRNNRGLTESRTEALGTTAQRVTTTQWHASFRRPTKVISPGNVTDYVHDTIGNVLSVSVSGGGKTRAWNTTYNADGQPLTIDGPRTDLNDITTMTYYSCTSGNECGQLKSVTNALGHVTNYDAYDGNGRLTQMTEANGLTTTLAYDLRGRIVTVTQTPQAGAPRVTAMSYDDVGQLVSYGLPNGVSLTYAYDAAHYLVAVTDNLGNQATYSYDVMGNQTGEDTFDPLSNLTRSIAYTHDLNDRLDTIASGGFTTDVTFDLAGNLVSEADPGNAVTQHVYDALNRIDSTTDAMSGLIDYSFDSSDNLTQVTAANGATTGYQFDALNNLVSETSADRGLTTYTYDDAGNQLTATDARAVTVTYTYDALNRVVSASYPNPAENVSFVYDTATNGIGRLASITDQSGTTTYAYDEFGNVSSDQRQVSGVTFTTAYQYDSTDSIVSITYPSGRTIDYARDTAGQVTQVSSTRNGTVKTIVSSASYEPFGPVSSLIYGNSVVFDYQYGLDNKIVSINSSGIAGKAYSYDAAGNIVATDDSIVASNSQIFEFDALDRLTFSGVDRMNFGETSSAYADEILADGPLLYWRLSEANGLVATDLSGNAGDGTYSGSVMLGASGLATGGDTAMRIDTEGAGYVVGPILTGTTVTGLEAWFQTDTADNYRDIVSLHNNDWGRYGIGHFPGGRVVVWKGISFIMVSDDVVSTNQPHHIAVWFEAGSNTTYLMVDGVTQQQTFTGNLLAESNPEVLVGVSKYRGVLYRRYLGEIDEVAIYDGPVSAATFSGRINISEGIDFTYDANGNRTSTHAGVSVTTYGYQPFSNRLDAIGGSIIQLDAAGNLISDAVGTRTYQYNNTGRLATVLDNGIQTTSYAHNALGQRTKKTMDNASTVYLYNLTGQLIAEHDSSGSLIRDYIWLIDRPVAQVDPGEVFTYLHFDHLGTPRLATDDNQTVVWRWDSDAFGTTLADEDPDGNGTSVTVNLRFPGQYFDAETGFHYNYFRTYDPSTGRYLESDPIGLLAGPNTYAYVENKPTKHTDSLGLGNDNGILYGLPSPVRDGMRDHIANQPAPVADALVNHGKTIGGALTYARGNYRSLRHLARSSGLLGKCEKVKAALEGQALAEALDRLSSDPGMRSDLSDLIFATAASNPYRTLGRASAGSIVTYYSRGSLGLAGALGALNGDIRNLVETQGPNIALDKLAEAIALGKAPAGAHEWLDQAIDCSCYE